MTHENDVTWAFSRTYAAALAICVVKLEAVADPLQDTLGAIDAAGVTLVTDATGQAASRLGHVVQPQVYLVKSGAPLGRIQRFTIGRRLTFKQVQFHRIGANDLIVPDIDVAECLSMLADLYMISAQHVVHVHGGATATANSGGDSAFACGEIPDRKQRCFQQAKELGAFPDLGCLGEHRNVW